jgi:hypothetical protein
MAKHVEDFRPNQIARLKPHSLILVVVAVEHFDVECHVEILPT